MDRRSLLSYFPHYRISPNGEIHSPCPFCDGGEGFVGEDRLVWFNPPSVLYCRHCGTHTYGELLQRLLGITEHIEPDFVEPAAQHRQTKLTLIDEDHVMALHRAVDRSYWKAFGWQDRIIDAFKLGFGKMYPGAFSSQRADRHIIPFRLFDGESSSMVEGGYALEGRLPPGSESTEPRNIKTGGVTKRYFFTSIHGVGSTLFVAEGLKDALSALHCYDDVIAFFGSASDFDLIARYINDSPFTEVILAMDHDSAGERYFNALRTRIVDRRLFRLRFPDNAPSGSDFTDLFAEGSFDRHRSFYEVDPQVPRGFIQDIRVYYPDYRPSVYPVFDAATIRQELSSKVRDYLQNYSEKYRTRFLFLKCSPGSGKSRALVRELEQFVAEDETRRAVLLAPFLSGWTDVQNHTERPDRWFNYQARTEENCQNFKNVSLYAQKGYNAHIFCRRWCPFFFDCSQTGYLAQRAESDGARLVYARHPMLLQESFLDSFDAIAIDECFLPTVDEPMIVKKRDFKPNAGWESYPNREAASSLETLLDAVKKQFGSEYLTGRAFYEAVDRDLGGRLVEVLAKIDNETVSAYQDDLFDQTPDVESIPMRCVPRLIAIMRREIGRLQFNQDFASCIFVIDSVMELYFHTVIRIAKSKRVIVADGTGNSELYRLVLNREPVIVGGDVINPLTKTVVLYGSDFTRTAIKTQTGSLIYDFEQWLEEKDWLPYDWREIEKAPVSDDFYDSSLLKKAFAALRWAASRHRSLLVVTHKSIRALLEYRFSALEPHYGDFVQFAHYGSLRGTNRYQELDAVMLIGCPRVSYQLLHRRINAYASLVESLAVDFDLTYVPQPYDGTYSGYASLSFVDPFAHRFLTWYEQSEIIQALERIRPHTSSSPKTVYLCLSRPAARAVTDVKPIASVIRTKPNHAEAFAYALDSLRRSGALPTYREVSDRFRMSASTVKSIFHDARIYYEIERKDQNLSDSELIF